MHISNEGIKQFEKGGSMYRGNVVAKYTQGQQIDAVVEVFNFK